jgi:hypothetical protein
MEAMRAQAAYLRVALRLGIHTVSDVIRWSDTEIARLDEPPFALIELALLENGNPLDVMSKLHELSAGVPALCVLRRVLGQAHEGLVRHPELGPIVAQGLYQIYVESGYQVPDDLAPMIGFDDRFALAQQGIGETEEEVLRDLIEFTRECKERPNPVP